jgi:type IV pilus assembly protein PilE
MKLEQCERQPVSQCGFSLIELLVVVAIVAILASVSYSAYTESTARSRRVAARALVMDVMQHEERFYTENNAYTSSLTAMGYGATLNTDRNTHSISLAAGATGALQTSVAVTATAITADPKCTTLTLTSANARSGTGSQSALCWQ